MLLPEAVIPRRSIDDKSVEAVARCLPFKLVDHEASGRAPCVADDADDARRELFETVVGSRFADDPVICVVYWIAD